MSAARAPSAGVPTPRSHQRNSLERAWSAPQLHGLRGPAGRDYPRAPNAPEPHGRRLHALSRPGSAPAAGRCNTVPSWLPQKSPSHAEGNSQVRGSGQPKNVGRGEGSGKGEQPCGRYAGLARRRGATPRGSAKGGRSSSRRQQGCQDEPLCSARVAQIRSMLQNKFEKHSGSFSVLPAFRRMTHESSHADPRRRQASAQDLACYLSACGANATAAEAAHLVAAARGQKRLSATATIRDPAGDFGMHTFHQIIRGQPSAEEKRLTKDTLHRSGLQSPAARASTRCSSTVSDPAAGQMSAATLHAGQIASKIGSQHWDGARR
eukprot:TRINITY_DN20805_c1_g2_i1.p1 TRINITY_DN20805_c1_g2~~TRINITY_DN20805_c1_g2_i1.p1  ORF type:complete len:331 (+),score=41.62 TRINITY_DN20805_c1_g2_i1:33-995(+)